MSTSGAGTAAIPEARYQCQCGAVPECETYERPEHLHWFDPAANPDWPYQGEAGWYSVGCLEEVETDGHDWDPESFPVLTYGPSLAAVMENRR